MTIGRSIAMLIVGASVSLLNPSGANLLSPVVTSSAHAEEAWKDELSLLCAKTNEAMSMSAEELKTLVAGCDKLVPVIEGLDESTRKVYRKRLKMCRDLYVYVLESKEQKK